jgi:hypothetical protein
MQWIGRSGDRGRTLNLCLLPKIGHTGFLRVKMSIALRKRTLSPVRLVLEDYQNAALCYLLLFLCNWGV